MANFFRTLRGFFPGRDAFRDKRNEIILGDAQDRGNQALAQRNVMLAKQASDQLNAIEVREAAQARIEAQRITDAEALTANLESHLLSGEALLREIQKILRLLPDNEAISANGLMLKTRIHERLTALTSGFALQRTDIKRLKELTNIDLKDVHALLVEDTQAEALIRKISRLIPGPRSEAQRRQIKNIVRRSKDLDLKITKLVQELEINSNHLARSQEDIDRRIADFQSTLNKTHMKAHLISDIEQLIKDYHEMVNYCKNDVHYETQIIQLINEKKVVSAELVTLIGGPP